MFAEAEIANGAAGGCANQKRKRKKSKSQTSGNRPTTITIGLPTFSQVTRLSTYIYLYTSSGKVVWH